MKKRFGARFAVVGLAAAMAVSFAGCDGGAPDVKNINVTEVLRQVQENMNDTKSASITMDISLDMTNKMLEENNRMLMNAAVDVDLKEEPFQLHMAANVNADIPDSSSEKMQAEIYVVPDGDDYMGYMGEGEDEASMTWEKQAISAEDVAELEKQFQSQTEDADQQKAQEQLYALLEESVSLEATGRERVGNVNALVISGELRFSDLMEALEKTGAKDLDLMYGFTDMPEEMQDIFETITVPMQIYVDEANMTLVKCSFDLKTTFEEIFKQAVINYMPTTSEPIDEDYVSALIPIEINAAEISVTINAVGDAVADIQVPASVVAQAVEGTDGESISLPLFNDSLVNI